MNPVVLTLGIFLLTAPVRGQEPAAITVSGTVQQPLTLTAADLKGMPAIDLTINQQTDSGPSTGKYHGALLWQVITKAALINDGDKNAYIRHTILVIGKDGYAAALSEAEIDPNLEGKEVILAYEKDGQALDGPQLVVPGDAHASRSVHDVTSIEVR
jgi:hypothetical protein